MFVWFIIRHSAEAAARENHLHARAARHPRGTVRQDAVPGYLHERRGGSQDQPARVQSPGESSRTQRWLTSAENPWNIRHDPRGFLMRKPVVYRHHSG